MYTTRQFTGFRQTCMSMIYELSGYQITHMNESDACQTEYKSEFSMSTDNNHNICIVIDIVVHLQNRVKMFHQTTGYNRQ